MIRALLLAVLCCCAASSVARGQFTTPFFSQEGVAPATQYARLNYAPDNELVFIGTLGDFTLPEGQLPVPLTFSFYLDSAKGSGLQPPKLPGQADAWIYAFHSIDSAKTTLVVGVKIFGSLQVQALGEGVPLPVRVGAPLDLTGTYASSGAMTRRLSDGDSVYRSFRRRLPGALPRFVTLGQVADSVQLPIPFLDGPIWTMSFIGAGDSTMTCFVASKSGETLCRAISLPGAGVDGPRDRGAELLLLPNPARGRVRLVVGEGLRGDIAGARLRLVDERGGLLRDLGAAAIDGSDVSIDLDGLPVGPCFLLVAGSDWRATLPIMIEE